MQIVSFFLTHSLGICLCEFFCLGWEGLIIFGEQVSDLGFKWVVSVGVSQQGHDTLDDKLGVQSGDPVVLDGLGADLTGVLLYVRVEDLGLEQNLINEVQ